VRHGGDISLCAVEAEHGELPETWRCLTAGGGVHIYFRAPGQVRNRVGVFPGVDIRGDGGYVVAPPTVLEGGRSYVWESEHSPREVALAEAPAWLLGLLAVDNGKASPRPPDEWAALVAKGAAEGGRNDTVARLAGYLMRHLPPRVVLELLRAFNASRCRPPLPDGEVVQVVESIAGREAARRNDPQNGDGRRDVPDARQTANLLTALCDAERKGRGNV
jgi:hypothetical protein